MTARTGLSLGTSRLQLGVDLDQHNVRYRLELNKNVNIIMIFRTNNIDVSLCVCMCVTKLLNTFSNMQERRRYHVRLFYAYAKGHIVWLVLLRF